MPAQKKVFGSPRVHSGKVQSAEATHVPVEMVAQMATKNAIPTTVSTTVFRIDGGADAPVSIWNGKDYFELHTTKTFTWSTSNTILDATSGAVLTAQSSITAGVWYWYIGITGSTDTAYAINLYPSKVAPSPVGSGEYGVGWFTHPGTAKENFWTYVGFSIINTAGDSDTAPVQTAATKKGFWYTMAEQVSSQTGQSSAAATADFSAILPTHGCEVAGYLTNAGASSEFIVSDTTLSDSTAVGIVICANDDTGAVTMPFNGLIPDSSGYLYSIQSDSAACTIGVTRVKDVI